MPRADHDATHDIELIQRLLLAAAIGGLSAPNASCAEERRLRTNILIGSAPRSSPSPARAGPAIPRIAAQIVTGIGFLGRRDPRNRDGVHGLTTAATVWVNAALGVAAGGGQFHLAIIGGAIVLAVLLVLGRSSGDRAEVGPKRTP